jgi:hypothetical protein
VFGVRVIWFRRHLRGGVCGCDLSWVRWQACLPRDSEGEWMEAADAVVLEMEICGCGGCGCICVLML